MWDSVGDNPAESYTTHNFTRAAVYDPVTNSSKRVDVPGYNIFCAGFVQLANGNVFVAGGNLDSALSGIRQTHVFDWRTETWSRGPDMQDGRWYPSVASMPNDEALIIGGGPTTAEIRTVSGNLRRLTGFTTPSSRAYPFVQAIPDGRALLLGPSTAMSLVDQDGIGALTAAGSRDSICRGYGSYANFDIGRFLVAGGGNVSEDGLTGVPTRTARVVDTRSGAPVATATGSLITRRRQHNLTVLADGSVLATGGQRTNGGGGLVDLANPSYTAESWDPGDRRMDRARCRRGRAPVPLDRDAAARRARAHRRRRDLRRLPVGRLSAPRLRDLHAAVSLPAGRQRRARAAADHQRRARNPRLRRRVHAHEPRGREHPQARARAARRADAQPGPGPALHTAAVHCLRHDDHRGRAEQPERGARRPLHAVRRRCRRRPERRADRVAAATGRGDARAGQPRAQPAGHREHRVRRRRDAGQGRQRLRLGRTHRQVLHQGDLARATCAWTSDRAAP